MKSPRSLTYVSGVTPMCNFRLALKLICSFLLITITATSQPHTGGIVAGFEIDENYPLDDTIINQVQGTVDWYTALGLHLGGAVCAPPISFFNPSPSIGQATWQLDDRWNNNNQDASAFGGTSNKNDDHIGAGQSPWTTTVGSGPQKNDITNVYFHTRVDANSQRWLIFGAETRAANGDSHVDWEYNQVGVTFDETEKFP